MFCCRFFVLSAKRDFSRAMPPQDVSVNPWYVIPGGQGTERADGAKKRRSERTGGKGRRAGISSIQRL
jgi:hypothetical protein